MVWRLILSLLVVSPAMGQTSVERGRPVFTAAGGAIDVEFDSTLGSRVVMKSTSGRVPLGPFAPSEFLLIDCKPVEAFLLEKTATGEYSDSLGKGTRFEISGRANGIRKKISAVCYTDFPGMVLFNVSYENTGTSVLKISEWTSNRYVLSPGPEKGEEPAFWSFQPGSYGWDNDWILPLKEGYSRDNFLGMTGPDYGGGTPVADVWRREAGVAVGHVELVPKIVSLPVTMNSSREASLGIACRKVVELKPGEVLKTPRTFVMVHAGDHFSSLTAYRLFMERQGITFKDPPEDAYKTEWCGWGYEEGFTMEQMRGTYSKIKELGLEWVVMDMGWYRRIGDYRLDPENFPNGEKDMLQAVSEIHAIGAKGQLWWMPLGVDPGTELFKKHPEYLILDENGSPRYMPTFFKAFYLCPAVKEVREHHRQEVLTMMGWGWDGLKIDGYNLNTVPPCYNPAHKHAYPEESVEQLPAFHKMVFETALSVNPRAKIEVCPCGTNQSFHILPYMNETVASDPHGSRHIRIKGKTLKALTGGKLAYYGDHVELSDNKEDFASTIGVGGTIGTKFVYPPGVHMNTESGDVSLTPEKERHWKKWIAIAKEHMLPKGQYRGELYDMGFDIPEAHAIQKGKAMYYAFFAPQFSGTIELRGLENRSYTVVDYEQGKTLGKIKGPVAKLDVAFAKHLLIRAE
jgi:alpha-galactosidase